MKKIALPVLVFLAASLRMPLYAEAELKIPVGAAITVQWRTVPAKTNFFEHKGKFSSRGVIKAVKSPFGDGGVTGSSLITFIKSKKPKGKIVECRALTFAPDADPATQAPRATIVIRNDESLYDNYIMQLKDKSLVLYVFVVVE